MTFFELDPLIVMQELPQATRRAGLEPPRCGSTSRESQIYCLFPSLKQMASVSLMTHRKSGSCILPKEKGIVFKRDTCLCDRMPHIDICEHKEVFALRQTVRKNFKGYTKRQVQPGDLSTQSSGDGWSSNR